MPLRPMSQSAVMSPLSVDWIPKLQYLDGSMKFGPTPNTLTVAGVTIGIAAAASIYATHPSNLIHSITKKQTTPVSIATTQATPAQPQPSPTPSYKAEVAAVSAKLQSSITSFASSEQAGYFIYIKDLKSGATASLNADKVIESASLYKAFVANQIYLLSDRGLVDLDGPTGQGMNVSINTCLNRMITISDNDCGRALGARLGWHAQHESFRQQGYKSTNFFATPTLTNAQDVGVLLENIYTAKYLKPASHEALLNLLKAQRVNNRLPQGLPAGTTIAHKTGELDGYMHDAGIVFGPKSDYIIVAMSGPWNNQTSSYASQTKLSQLIYNQLQN